MTQLIPAFNDALKPAAGLLAEAISNNYTGKVKELLRRGADITEKDIMGRDAMDLAIELDKMKIVDLLIAHSRPHIMPEIEPPAEDPLKPKPGELMNAINGNDLAQVKDLLQRGVDYTKENKEGFDPLMVAVELGHFLIVKALIEAGADIQKKKDYVTWPLSVAARAGNMEIARLLIAYGAEVEAMDDRRRTTLILASLSDDNNEMMRLLIEKGADVNARSKGGGMVLFGLAGRGNLEMMRLLFENSAEVNAAEDGGVTSLIWAVYQNQLEAAALLLEHGADIDVIDSEGKTVWHYAADSSNPAMLQVLEDYSRQREQQVKHEASVNGQLRMQASRSYSITVRRRPEA